VGTHPAVRPPLIRRGAYVAAAILTAAGLLTSAGAAAAAPQPTVSSVQARVNKLTNQLNVLNQQYDVASQNLAAARQRLALVSREIARDQTQFQNMRAQIAQIASFAYENGNMTSTAAVLTSNDPQTVLSQSAFLIHLSTSRYQQVQQFISAARQLTGAKKYSQRIETAIAGIKRQLGEQKAAESKLLAKQQSILATLTAQQRSTLIGGGGAAGGSYSGPTNTQAGKAVAFAYAQLGCPYVFGGTGPCGAGFDCSGLTSAAWAAAGVSIPRTSYGQAGLPSVSTSALQPGDILEFAGDSHVGIYVGGGMLIDAPQPGMNVEKVSLSSSWYASNLDGAVLP
jgi:cell wall-associated NlpC family hydrolase